MKKLLFSLLVAASAGSTTAMPISQTSERQANDYVVENKEKRVVNGQFGAVRSVTYLESNVLQIQTLDNSDVYFRMQQRSQRMPESIMRNQHPRSTQPVQHRK